MRHQSLLESCVSWPFLLIVVVCAGVWWPLLTDSPRFGSFVSLHAGVCCAVLADIWRLRGFPVVLSIPCCQLLVILVDPGRFCAFPAQLSLSYEPLRALRVGSRPILCVPCSFASFLPAIGERVIARGRALGSESHRRRRFTRWLVLPVMIALPPKYGLLCARRHSVEQNASYTGMADAEIDGVLTRK